MSGLVLRSLPSSEEIAKEKARRGTKIDFEEMPEEFKDHPGQQEAWNSTAQTIAVYAGWQSGKTTIIPPWLMREIQREGAGDYALTAPSYPLLRKKSLPEFKRFLRKKGMVEGLDWVHKVADQEIHFLRSGQLKIWGKPGECVIFLVHADSPNSVEAFTAKAMATDEPGQIDNDTWEGLEARVAVERGRHLLTGRPVTHNWYVYDIWNKRDQDSHLHVINFRSIDNPGFPKEEYYRQKAKLPPWKFKMKYDGIPTRPAGSIYDCFEPLFEDQEGKPLPPKVLVFNNGNEDFEVEFLGKNVCKRFEIPGHWPILTGHDFGDVNTAAVFAAKDPESCRMFFFRTYHAGGKTREEHVSQFKKRSGRKPRGSWGGAPSEQKIRDDYGKHGWPITQPPIKDVIDGIERTYSLIKTGVAVFFDDLTEFIKDHESYSWEVDDNGEPKIGVIDKKSKWHRLDAERYLDSAVYEGMGEEMLPSDRFPDEEGEDFIYPEEEGPVKPFAHLGWDVEIEDEEPENPFAALGFK